MGELEKTLATVLGAAAIKAIAAKLLEGRDIDTIAIGEVIGRAAARRVRRDQAIATAEAALAKAKPGS